MTTDTANYYASIIYIYRQASTLDYCNSCINNVKYIFLIKLSCIVAARGKVQGKKKRENARDRVRRTLLLDDNNKQ